MLFHEASTDTAVLGHEGESESEVKFTCENRFRKAFSGSERSSAGSVDNFKSNIGLNSVITEGKETFRSDLNVCHIHGVVNGLNSHSTSDRSTNSTFLSLRDGLDKESSDFITDSFISSKHGSESTVLGSLRTSRDGAINQMDTISLQLVRDGNSGSRISTSSVNDNSSGLESQFAADVGNLSGSG